MFQTKNIPKDGQVIMAIMKEIGISEFEPKTVIQLTEFVYRYGSSILEEARQFAYNSTKKTVELDHVRLALQLQNESTFTMPPPREVALEVARLKNNVPLPVIKPPCGLRLPPDRHCLSAHNYTLKAPVKKPSSKVNGTKAQFIKRANTGINKQSVSVPKPLVKSASMGNQVAKTLIRPKIQISTTMQGVKEGFQELNELEKECLKRKREEIDEM